MQTLLIILEKGSSCTAFEFPFQRTFPLAATGNMWRWGMCCSYTKNRKSWSEVFRCWRDGWIIELTWETKLELLVIGWAWNGVWWGQEKRRWTRARGQKKFLETQTITLQLQLFRVMCSSEKGWGIFFLTLFGLLTYVYICQSIGIKTLFSVFLAGSKPMEVQQLPLDELKNK